MKVSVVICALNEEKVIEQTLRTIRAQKTNHKIELLLGDGYSTDKTVRIAKKYVDKVVFEKHHSAAWERQAAAKKATGEIILFTDADTRVPKSWVENYATQFEKDKDLVMCYSGVQYYDLPEMENALVSIVMGTFLSIMSLFGAHNAIGSNMAVRRKAFEKIKGFDTSYVTCEDLNLAKRISRVGKITFITNNSLLASPRRIKKWGYWKNFWFHFTNGIMFQLTGKAKRTYDDVR